MRLVSPIWQDIPNAYLRSFYEILRTTASPQRFEFWIPDLKLALAERNSTSQGFMELPIKVLGGVFLVQYVENNTFARRH